VATGDGDGSAPSWLFWLALCVFYALRDFWLDELWVENSFMSERSRCRETPNLNQATNDATTEKEVMAEEEEH
jgi:hypothetical protein